MARNSNWRGRGGRSRRHPRDQRDQRNGPSQQGGNQGRFSKPSSRIQQVMGNQAAQPEQNYRPENQHHVNTMPELAVEYFPAIFHRLPELADRIPWVSLRGAERPSAPQRLNRSKHLFGDNFVFVRHESLDFHIMPDNKARKLEFVIGDVLRRRRKKLVTFGYIGSSHCLATVKAAHQLSMKSEVVLLKGPLSSTAVQMVAAMKNLGATVRLRSSMRGVMITAAWKWLCSRIFRTELIPPGGSDGRGVIGYVSAMAELREQIDDGIVPQPDYIFVAAGSGSTIVGLELGKRMFGLDSVKIMGVQTSDDRGVEVERLIEMGNSATDILNEHLNKKISFKFTGQEFQILKNYLYGGHGTMPEHLRKWLFQFVELETIELDPVYTSKALFGMSDFLTKNNIVGKNILFWNTASPFRQGDMPKNFSYNKLPFRLRRWMRREQSKGGLIDVGTV